MRIRNRRRYRRSGLQRALLLAGALVLTGAILFTTAVRRARPLLSEMADASITDVVSRTVNDTVTEMMGDGSLSYTGLVTLEKDDTGCVTAVITNMAQINTLQAEISGTILEELSSGDVYTIRIPAGNLLGGTLLSGRGPLIPIRVLAVNSVETGFRNEFTSAGINQTRHVILLHVEVTVSILIPGYVTAANVSCELSVAETVIVGRVPSAYAELGGE